MEVLGLVSTSLLLAVLRAFGTVPFALRFVGELHASEMEPFDGALQKPPLLTWGMLTKFVDLRLDCRSQSFRRRTLGGRGSKWVRWGLQAYRARRWGARFLPVQAEQKQQLRPLKPTE